MKREKKNTIFLLSRQVKIKAIIMGPKIISYPFKHFKKNEEKGLAPGLA